MYVDWLVEIFSLELYNIIYIYIMYGNMNCHVVYNSSFNIGIYYRLKLHL